MKRSHASSLVKEEGLDDPEEVALVSDEYMHTTLDSDECKYKKLPSCYMKKVKADEAAKAAAAVAMKAEAAKAAKAVAMKAKAAKAVLKPRLPPPPPPQRHQHGSAAVQAEEVVPPWRKRCLPAVPPPSSSPCFPRSRPRCGRS